MFVRVAFNLMDIDKVISKVRNLSEAPTNSVGNTGYTNSGSSTALGGFDKFLFPPAEDLLDQDYQTPGQSGQARWRFSNVYPAQKLSLSDIDNMVDASKDYTKIMDDKRLANIMNMVRSIREEVAVPTNNASSGAIAGLPPDQPPVNLKKKKKRPPIIARGLMPGARKRWSNG